MEIAGTYVRAAYSETTQSELEEASLRAERRFIVISREVFQARYKLEVEFVEASLISRTKVLVAAVPIIWGGFATYPDFKNGIAEAYNDARYFGERAIEVFKDVFDIPDDCIRYKRAVPPTISRLKKATDDVEAIVGAQDLPPKVLERRISDLYSTLPKLLRDGLPEKAVNTMLCELPRDRVPNLPRNVEEVLLEGNKTVIDKESAAYVPKIYRRRQRRVIYRNSTVITD